MLQEGAWDGDVKPILVHLPPGPLSDEDLGAWAYFPVDALIGLMSSGAPDACTVVVGHHGCVMSSGCGMSMHAHVVSPGWVYKLDWMPVHQDPGRFAPWLWQTAAVTQQLMGQMAQWSFCVHHHSPSQRLASWLLHALTQTSHAELKLSWKGLPLDLQRWLAHDAAAASLAADEGGYTLEADGVRAMRHERLRAQACTCHVHMATPSAPLVDISALMPD